MTVPRRRPSHASPPVAGAIISAFVAAIGCLLGLKNFSGRRRAVGEEEIFDERGAGQSQQAISQDARSDHEPSVRAAIQYAVHRRLLLSLAIQAFAVRS